MIYEIKQTYVLIEYLSEMTKKEKEEKEERRKRRMLKNNFTDSIRCYQRKGWMDFSELRAIDSLHNEGTNTLVMGGLG